MLVCASATRLALARCRIHDEQKPPQFAPLILFRLTIDRWKLIADRWKLIADR